VKFFLGATIGEDIETLTVQRIFLTASTADALVTNSAPIKTVFSGSSCVTTTVELTSLVEMSDHNGLFLEADNPSSFASSMTILRESFL